MPPKRGDGRTAMQYRAMTGRVLPGVELRIVDDAGARAAVGRQGRRRD